MSSDPRMACPARGVAIRRVRLYRLPRKVGGFHGGASHNRGAGRHHSQPEKCRNFLGRRQCPLLRSRGAMTRWTR